MADMTYRLHVWFATSQGYRQVAASTDREWIEREARAYFSDSRGITLTAPDGSVMQLKPESR